ncbi:MAG TPA: hypothetical protein VKN18_12815 [Blastocatellia bacterium]|nr:hypothetical protein [Blastocatellia bacterium]
MTKQSGGLPLIVKRPDRIADLPDFIHNRLASWYPRQQQRRLQTREIHARAINAIDCVMRIRLRLDFLANSLQSAIEDSTL